MKAIKFTKRIAELATELTEESRVYIKLKEHEGVGNTKYISLTRVKASDFTVDIDGDLILNLILNPGKIKNG